jgi:uncharacterized protein (TIGR00251 family)
MSIILKVKIIPKSSRTEIVGQLGKDTLKIKIKAVPEKGKANKELIKLLSKKFKVPQKNIIILRGASSPLKHIKIIS